MSRRGGHEGPPLILHVLPLAIDRGAQVQVRSIVDALRGNTVDHRILVIFGPANEPLNPDIALNAKAGRLRAMGFSPTAFVRLWSSLRRLRPRAVIAHGSEPLKYLALASPLKTPIVYHRIGVSSPRLENPLRLFVHKAAVRRAAAVVAVSEDALDELRERLQAPLKRSVVIQNARDPSLFVPVEAEPVETPHLLFVGHLSTAKRPDVFMDVVEALRRQGLRFEAEMCGEGPMYEGLARRAESLGVTLHGHCDDVPTRLAHAQVLLFTGLPFEGLPGVLVEAALAGLPAVSTDVPGATEVIVDRKTGFIVGVHDFDTTVARVAQLLSDARQRTEMGVAARAHALSRFTTAASAEKWSDLLRSLVET